MKMQAAGVRMHYELAGQGRNRVVLLHGWGCSTKLMKPVADFLAKDMTVLSVDFPGHGESGRPPEPWGVREYAACLKELLTALDFLPCSVIAHSFGGRVTIELASGDASLFDRIILTGAAGIKPPSSGSASKRTEQYRRLKGIASVLGKVKPLSGVAEAWQEKLIQEYGSKDYAALDPEMRKTFVKVVNYDQSELLSSIRNSTLLVWGSADTETPLWMGQQMEKSIPDSALIVLEGGTHFAYIEQAARFNAIAHSFLVESNENGKGTND